MQALFAEHYDAVCGAGEGAAPVSLWCFKAVHCLESLRKVCCNLSSKEEMLQLIKPKRAVKPKSNASASALGNGNGNQPARPARVKTTQQAMEVLDRMDDMGQADEQAAAFDEFDDELLADLAEQLLATDDTDDMNAEELARQDRELIGELEVQRHEEAVIDASLKLRVGNKKLGTKKHKAAQTHIDANYCPNDEDDGVAATEDIAFGATDVLDLSGLTPEELAHEALLNSELLGGEPHLKEMYKALKHTSAKPVMNAELLDAAISSWASSISVSAAAIKMIGKASDDVLAGVELSLIHLIADQSSLNGFHNYPAGIHLVDWQKQDSSQSKARLCKVDKDDKVIWNIPARIPVLTLDAQHFEMLIPRAGIGMVKARSGRPIVPPRVRRLATMCEAALVGHAENRSDEADASKVEFLSTCVLCGASDRSHSLRTCAFCLSAWHVDCETAAANHAKHVAADTNCKLLSAAASIQLPACMRHPTVFFCSLCKGPLFIKCWVMALERLCYTCLKLHARTNPHRRVSQLHCILTSQRG